MAVNVLIVDDSAVMRQVIAKVLRLCGAPVAAVHQAANGVEGLACIAKNPIDLVLVDINMPLMNGLEMLGLLRANAETSDVPVIVISTDGTESRAAEIRNLRAELVQKPFSPESLGDAIRRVLGVKDEERDENGAS